jgi:hypothetical protein
MKLKRIYQSSIWIAGAVFFASLVQADSNVNLDLKPMAAPDMYELKWDGTAGYIYFIKQSADLTIWNTLPIYKFPQVVGEVSVGIESDAEKLFFRLLGSSDPKSELLASDFNGSGVSNYQEILQGTDPFYWDDLPPNGLPDAWELFWFDVVGNGPSSADLDQDGLTELQEFSAATNPTKRDHPLLRLSVNTQLGNSN